MNGKTTLKRLEGLAARRPQDAFADEQRAKLDAMTDEELDRQIAALKRALALVMGEGEQHNDE